jgi:hypothetical protein
MSATSSESYAPVSRGLRDHLSTMSGNAVKLYMDLLLNAAFTGPNKGQVAVSFAELALSPYYSQKWTAEEFFRESETQIDEVRIWLD